MANTAALPPAMDHQQQKRLHEFLTHERPPPAKPPTHVTNDISDIRGARPLLKDHVYSNKPHFYEPQDIAGSTSKQLHPTHRRVGAEDRYKQLPIEGTTTQPAGFKTNRVCDPLQPDYKLPSFQEAPPVIPKFLRDSYNVSDIDGTSFKKKVIEHPRSPLRLDDIAGAQAGWLPAPKRALRDHPPRDILDVADITNVDFRSSRVTNVLNPVYTVNGLTFQDDELSHPTQLHMALNKPHYALQTSDIVGANPLDASKNVVGGIPHDKRRGFRATNRTNDIEGATADTVLHSIKSNRRVDPNWPEYDVLDGKKADSSALSVAKSIVFADLIREHGSLVWKREHAANGAYVVSGVANVGMVSNSNNRDKDKPPRRSTAPASAHSSGSGAVMTSSRTLTAAGSAATTTARATPSDRKQAEARREEIQMVRDLK